MFIAATYNFMAIDYAVGGKSSGNVGCIVQGEFDFGYTCAPECLSGPSIGSNTGIYGAVQSFYRVRLAVMAWIRPVLDLKLLKQIFKVQGQKRGRVIGD